ncbi:hypothetical protein [Halohasta salina]|nr:hypothetical protein [Halohasta salina]
MDQFIEIDETALSPVVIVTTALLVLAFVLGFAARLVGLVG